MQADSDKLRSMCKSLSSHVVFIEWINKGMARSL